MKPGGGRNKGHSFERKIARILRKFYPEARRGLQYQDEVDCGDVVGTPYHIECKRRKRVSVQDAYEQAQKDNKRKLPILVIHKEDRKPVLVTMNLDVFMEIISRN